MQRCRGGNERGAFKEQQVIPWAEAQSVRDTDRSEGYNGELGPDHEGL